MRKYNPPKAVTPPAQRVWEYCTIECGNRDCRLNLVNCRKGERFTVRRFYGTERCRGYRAS